MSIRALLGLYAAAFVVAFFYLPDEPALIDSAKTENFELVPYDYRYDF